ncbi:MAG TPA: rRNA maturation RNase YbeY [Tepidimicrobium sp.]|nr:rRNA maturation RNase YbeY [Tepidimicrobium sp.]
MNIYIDNRQDRVKLDREIHEVVERALRETLLLERGSLDYEVSVSFVGDGEIRELNRDYRGMDKATDVLSFPLEEDFMESTPLLGDIVISAERALKQAKEYNHSFIREVAYLTVHSALHLLGYDHMEDDERRRMRSKEKEIMGRLNIFRDRREG